MAEQQSSPSSPPTGYQLARTIGLRYGLILGLLLGGLSIGLYMVDLFSNEVEIWFTIPLMMLAMVLSMLRLRQQQGEMTLGQGFRTGLTTAVMAALINGVMTSLYTGWVDPGATERALDRTRERMLAAGDSPERVNLYTQFMEQLEPPQVAIPATIIVVAFFGSLLALLLAWGLRKSPTR